MIIFYVFLGVIIVLYLGLLCLFTDRRANPHLDLNKLKDAPWKFGEDFLWGSATSSHQVEGYCTNNNWYKFESAINKQGKPRILNSQKAGVASDHWNRYKEDIQLMKALSLNAYRFSVEWSKIEPQPGVYDEAALDHYAQVIDELLANGIEPMVTLHHFTDPIWFEEQGAFLRENSPDIFAAFVEKVVRRLGSRVKLWCTINEPTVYAMQGYLKVRFPPAVKDPKHVGIVLRNLLRAHTAAYQRIKKVAPQAQVGLVMALTLYDPPNPWNLLDVILARSFNRSTNEIHLTYLVDGLFKFAIPDAVKVSYTSDDRDAFDFVGLNYYSRFFQKFTFSQDELKAQVIKVPPERLTDMRWEIYPEGLYRTLEMISRFTSKPIYITENGIADDSDKKRAGFIEDHLLVLNKAVADGMNVKGYFYWSLLDNFEWAFGFERRFGLYHVDYATQKRTLREGSRKYPEIIRKSRGLDKGRV
jgi:beta-glucosidase